MWKLPILVQTTHQTYFTQVLLATFPQLHQKVDIFKIENCSVPFFRRIFFLNTRIKCFQPKKNQNLKAKELSRHCFDVFFCLKLCPKMSLAKFHWITTGCFQVSTGPGEVGDFDRFVSKWADRWRVKGKAGSEAADQSTLLDREQFKFVWNYFTILGWYKFKS